MLSCVEVVLEKSSPSDSPRKTSCSSPRSGRSLIKVGGVKRRSPPKNFHYSICDWEHEKLSPFIGVHTSFALSLRACRVLMRPSPPILPCSAIDTVSFPDSPCVQDVTTGIYLARLLDQIDVISMSVFRRDRVIFDHCSKRYHWSVKGHSESPFMWCLTNHDKRS